jgi:hypothetical protein
MSLTTKEEMTESSVSADCTSDLKTQGPATAGGKARSAAAKLRHEFYSQTRDEALIALGENPADYRRLLRSLADDLQPKSGLESELVLRMARIFWRMRRSERMQDGMAIKRAQSGTDTEELSTGIKLSRMMEDSSVRQLWRLTNTLIRAREGALTQRDVKNAG